MAEFLDSGSPEFVYAPNGLLVDRSALGPTDTVRPAAGATPPAAAPAPMATPAAPASPGGPPTAASLMAKRDAVLGPMVTTGSSTTTQRTPGISAAVLDPIMAGNTARTDAMANTVRQAGNDAATRKEEMADRDIYLSQGRQATADAAREDAAQRAEIARKNELALSLQKDAEIDPDRFVKNMSTGQQIATTVLAALNGGFKGMVGQSGNDVMDILSKRIDADIASQKEQVASGRVRRGNLVAYFQNQGLREEAAVKAAEATSWAMVDRMVAAEREKIGAGQDRTTADVMAEQLKMKTAERNDELKLTLGTDRTTTSTTTQRERLAPAGEMKPGDLSKAADDMKGARDIEQMKKSGLTEPEYQKQSTEFSEKAQKNDDLVSRAREVANALGGDIMEVKDKDGVVTGYKVTGDFDTPHFGDEATRYESAVSNLQRADVMGMAREPSATLQDKFSQAVEMPFRDEQKKARLQQVLNMALRERQNLRSGYNEHVVAGVETRKTSGGVPGSWK